jgi:succinate dehydrogenase / fumarate reductase cytochrome b subunit
MARPDRPLSPHLQVYRWQWTMALSILHRVTGVGLGLGSILLVYWLAAAAGGAGTYARAQGFVGSWFGLLLLFGFSLALFYHLANGIRHLFWDAGRGFELKTAYASGLAVLVAAVVLTGFAWIIGLSMWGAR